MLPVSLYLGTVTFSRYSAFLLLPALARYTAYSVAPAGAVQLTRMQDGSVPCVAVTPTGASGAPTVTYIPHESSFVTPSSVYDACTVTVCWAEIGFAVTTPVGDTVAYACPARAMLQFAFVVTFFFEPSEYVASHVNCADCPDVSEETPEMATEESVGLSGVALT